MEEGKRMKLYFGNAVAAATTLMILALLGFTKIILSKHETTGFIAKKYQKKLRNSCKIKWGGVFL